MPRDPWDLPPDPELVDILRVIARNIRLSMRTHVPASVVSYDPATQKAIVQVQPLQVVKVADATRIPTKIVSLKGVPPNAEATLQPIILKNIPVAWPRTLLGYVTFPLNAGDTGELHVSDRSMAAWLQTGIPSDPIMAFTHALQDGVFHPGLHSDVNPIVPPTDTTATVVEGTTALKLGRNAVSPAVKATELVAAVDAAIAAAVTAAAAIAPPAGDGGSSAFAAFKTAWDAAKASLQSLKVKIE